MLGPTADGVAMEPRLGQTLGNFFLAKKKRKGNEHCLCESSFIVSTLRKKVIHAMTPGVSDIFINVFVTWRDNVVRIVSISRRRVAIQRGFICIR